MAAKSSGADSPPNYVKQGYSPPPVSQVQRPKPPPAGPRQRAPEAAERGGRGVNVPIRRTELTEP